MVYGTITAFNKWKVQYINQSHKVNKIVCLTIVTLSLISTKIKIVLQLFSIKLDEITSMSNDFRQYLLVLF